MRLTDPERQLMRQAAQHEPLASWIRRVALEAAELEVARRAAGKRRR